VAVYRGDMNRPSGAAGPGVASALRLVAEQHESAVIDTDLETEQSYRAALRQIQGIFATGMIDEDRLADAVAERVALRLQRGHAPETSKRRRHRSLVGTAPVPPDAYVDQWSDLVPHDVFLRLALEGRFESARQGQRIIARWGDVQSAIKSLGQERQQPRDPMNELRAQLGLIPKGGR